MFTSYLTRVHDKRSKAKPSTINFPEDWAQLCLCIAPIIMVSQYCTEIKSNNQCLTNKYGFKKKKKLFIKLKLELAAVPLLLQALGCVDLGK